MIGRGAICRLRTETRTAVREGEDMGGVAKLESANS